MVQMAVDSVTEGSIDPSEEGTQADLVSVVVPAYNEERAIKEYLTDLTDELERSGLAYEVVVVNDGSADETASRARELPGVTLVEHERNRGYGAALKTGIRVCNGDTIVITDADGTYPPSHTRGTV